MYVFFPSGIKKKHISDMKLDPVHVLLSNVDDCSFVLPAARVLSCVRVVCLRVVLPVRVSARMKRGKKTEEAAAADGDNDAGIAASSICHSLTLSPGSSFLTSFLCFYCKAATKKAKKTKEPEAPILYDDPPDKLTSKDGRAANFKITSWNVDGLRAWVKKQGLDVSLGSSAEAETLIPLDLHG